MKQPRLPKATSERISVVAPEAKVQLIEITEKSGETLKEVIERLVDQEYKGGKEMELEKYKVVAEDNLYFERIGERILQTYATVVLSIDGENVVFEKHEVKKFKGEQWER